ncbi:MAG TPA: nucleotidyltransferase family protein [Phycisphaerales bacterium]|nr:nucleotidyltransferase family protein [Phycisphaerales bacterium]
MKNDPRQLVSAELLAAFCRRWGIKRLAIFGSGARGELSPESDIDLLVEFLPGHGITFENFVEMEDDASALFGGRKIDLVEPVNIRNPFRRERILKEQVDLYAA